MSSIESTSERDEQDVYSSSSEDEYNDVQNKRVKLAKEYLNNLQEEDVESTLQNNLLEKGNKVNKSISNVISIRSTKSIRQRLSLTHSIITFPLQEAFLVYSSKDNNLYQQHLYSKQRHILATRNALCLATSPDFKWLAVGTSNNTIDIYNTLTTPFSLITTLSGFKDSISVSWIGLLFHSNTPSVTRIQIINSYCLVRCKFRQKY